MMTMLDNGTRHDLGSGLRHELVTAMIRDTGHLDIRLAASHISIIEIDLLLISP